MYGSDTKSPSMCSPECGYVSHPIMVVAPLAFQLYLPPVNIASGIVGTSPKRRGLSSVEMPLYSTWMACMAMKPASYPTGMSIKDVRSQYLCFVGRVHFAFV
jgi:hypothetical protein